jgi:thiazolylpeptide-type bacteriocin precursor
MEDKLSLAALARELLTLESETFEVRDYAEETDILLVAAGGTSTSSTSSTTSTTSCTG